MDNEKKNSKLNTKYKIAAVLMIIHGGLMEAGTAIFMLPLVTLLKVDTPIKQNVFAIEFFQDNMELMIGMGLIFGVCRIVASIGLLKNRMWGFVMSIINCVVTMAVMIFMIPAGVMDGILACTALVLLLQGYYGDRKIGE